MRVEDMEEQGLYRSDFEHDACGVGFVAHLKGVKSHREVQDALTMLENMEHRGACGCDEESGDGAGIMIQIPHEFLWEECSKLDIQLGEPGYYGVGMTFLPKEKELNDRCILLIKEAAAQLNLNFLGIRNVPVNPEGVGVTALSAEPDIIQFFIGRPKEVRNTEDFDRKLFVLRRLVVKKIKEELAEVKEQFYMPSLSSKTLIYKGQLTTYQVRSYFNDLSDERVVSAFGLVHSRFSTNTFPSWKLAQPFRIVAHNGEINTLTGNLNRFYAGLRSISSPYFTEEELEILLPVVDPGLSDSASLDNVVELLLHSGRTLPHVMLMLVPEAWDGNNSMDPLRKAFYEYHATIMEPWDGPAALCFTNGKTIGAMLDRNGLRPLRFAVTNDDRVVVASEAGALPIEEKNIIKKGRQQPGKIFLVDMERGEILSDNDIKYELASKQPYGEWLEKYKIHIKDLAEPRVTFTYLSKESVLKYQQIFGYSREDVEGILVPMALDGKEPIGSMGTDVPLAVLSEHPQHLSSYFKQYFAQVTNPPIDPIRERLVMSLATFIGNSGNILDEDKMHCHCVALEHPIVTSRDLEKLRSIDTGIFQAKTLQTYFQADGKEGSLEEGLARLCRYAEDAVRDGFEVLILSDRAIDSQHAAIPSLLAVSAVHHHLIKTGYRGAVGLVVEAGDAWEVHHFACLLAFGATAINPYMALATIRTLKEEGVIDTPLTWPELSKNYVKAVCNGLLKIFSKMGISTLQSYNCAQIFEVLGIHKEVVDKYFCGAVSRIGGLKLDDIAKEVLSKHNRGFHSDIKTNLLPEGGIYAWRRRGEAHLFNPTTVHLLQQACRTGNYEVYKQYAAHINNQKERRYTLRGLFDFAKHRAPISLEEVEPAENIMKRFATGAMSFGSISHEAHSTLAIAMNRIGGKSNTGEGGEDEIRYKKLPNGDSMRSAIKQIASARFGVTSNYLAQADELQIKMAQGAKPGEGGQLPGHKVDDWIAKVRHATPGVGLISPPPHHDIYSIEDLKQLIFDLKNANREARINVKLVSKAGVGTIAAGVAKAHADVILIAGYDGGTGASPISSIKHAGLPWELGLAEAQQTLVKNQLRSRVVLQTDGQLKTGRDLAIAALLGAEEWGVATAALVAGGCIMMRKCHLNTCPVGVATQDPELRKLFTGKPEDIVYLFKFLAEELREIMASLGFKTINDMVGRAQFLKVREDIDHWKINKLDLSGILYAAQNPSGNSLYQTESQDHGMDMILDWGMLKQAAKALESKTPVFGTFTVKNTDRTIGTLLSNEVSKIYGSEGLPDNTINFKFEGSAGQSFGAFAAKGLSFELEGEANDYVGKGLSGAQLAIYPASDSTLVPHENIIIGNVALYGATSGHLFVCGQAGERFAVRNSGATTVVEGVGDHGCEYMTGGRALILGETGRNFAAGMSGGIAWVYDTNGTFKERCNLEMVDLDPLDTDDETQITSLLKRHINLTSSKLASDILSNWKSERGLFIKVFPKEYKRVLQAKLVEA